MRGALVSFSSHYPFSDEIFEMLTRAPQQQGLKLTIRILEFDKHTTQISSKLSIFGSL